MDLLAERRLEEIERRPGPRRAAPPRGRCRRIAPRAPRSAPASCAGEMDEADRLRRRAPVRPGDSGDADRDLGPRSRSAPSAIARAVSLAYRAMLRKRLGRNAKQFLLGGVGVDHEAALEHVRRPGNLRQEPGDQPPVHDSAVAAMSPAAL